jgi:hypothetical protein
VRRAKDPRRCKTRWAGVRTLRYPLHCAAVRSIFWVGRKWVKEILVNTQSCISRRSFLGVMAAAPLAAAVAKSKQIPVGLELYSVRNALEKDLMGTVRGVAEMGYEC